jgi:hypothetical protein
LVAVAITTYGGYQLEGDSKIRQIRFEIDVTREDLVRVSDVSLGTVRNAEKGKKINARSASQILKAINHWIAQKALDRSPLTLADLDLV